ncbi:MAG: T9SS type A sorting domain-containing protein [bacterium]|nr:T9SS type A sorting domain-containing protein [bacterium]
MDSAIGSEVEITSLALDSMRNPHIVYEKNGLIYTHYNTDSSKWVSDKPLGGSRPSLALDSSGYPHISCFFNGLGYIHKNITGWDTIEVYPGPWVDWTSIALDKKGNPHIGWTSSDWFDADMVLYTHWTGTIWETDTVDTVMGAGGSAGTYAWISIALDTANCPHLAYSSNGVNEYYAKKTLKEWKVERVDTPYNGAPSLKIDTLNRPCIAYFRGQTRYAVKEDTVWKIEAVETTVSCREAFLFIDKNNNSHISCVSSIGMIYAWRKNNIWYIENLDSFPMPTNLSSTSLAIDNNGYAHASYRGVVNSGGNGYAALKYIKGEGVGVEENNSKCLILNAKLEAKPNPFVAFTVISEQLSVKDKETKIQIYDVSGKLIEETKDNIIGKKLKSGVYFIKVNNYKPLKVVKLR